MQIKALFVLAALAVAAPVFAQEETAVVDEPVAIPGETEAAEPTATEAQETSFIPTATITSAVATTTATAITTGAVIPTSAVSCNHSQRRLFHRLQRPIRRQQRQKLRDRFTHEGPWCQCPERCRWCLHYRCHRICWCCRHCWCLRPPPLRRIPFHHLMANARISLFP
ncbi:hypothetical protein DFJ77DRAFT_161648 [Powellomyces hirtus]|nr:hypothetical protein DFJ77DRAFT_161648 [Powellomyces hirtus]